MLTTEGNVGGQLKGGNNVFYALMKLIYDAIRCLKAGSHWRAWFVLMSGGYFYG